MTLDEFSDQFDVLLSNYTSGYPQVNPPYYVDEYEKSVYLTKAQENLVITFYNGKGPNGDSFESSEEIRTYLRPLITEIGYNAINENHQILVSDNVYKHGFHLPSDLMFITFEECNIRDDSLNCGKEITTEVYPVTHDEYSRVIKNPFRGPTKLKVLRLDTANNNVQIISKYKLKYYRIKYIRKPSPIVLKGINFSNSTTSVSIDGVSEATECELPEILHRKILEDAVKLLIVSKNLTAPVDNKSQEQ